MVGFAVALATSLSAMAMASATLMSPTVVRPSAPPSPSQKAAVKRALASELADITSGQIGYNVATADVNGDGKLDLFILFQDVGFCGAAGCQSYLILASGAGFSSDAIKLPAFYEQVTLLPTIHAGLHDLRFDANRKAFQWNGKIYG